MLMRCTNCGVNHLVMVSRCASKTNDINRKEGSVSNGQMHEALLERLSATQAMCCMFFINESTVSFSAALERMLRNSSLILVNMQWYAKTS